MKTTKMKMKIIFLDFDGVLNCEEWYVQRTESTEEINSKYPFYEFSPKLVANLNLIVRETRAKVVISSSWRTGRSKEELQEMLEKVGFEGEVIGKTVNLGVVSGFDYTIPRGCEIEHWIDSHGTFKIENYVILDDDDDMLYEQRNNFVNTSWRTGLDEEATQKAIGILQSL